MSRVSSADREIREDLRHHICRSAVAGQDGRQDIAIIVPVRKVAVVSQEAALFEAARIQDFPCAVDAAALPRRPGCASDLDVGFHAEARAQEFDDVGDAFLDGLPVGGDDDSAFSGAS